MASKPPENPDYRYYSENPRRRALTTGQVRFRLQHRGSREPLLILQIEENHEEQKSNRGGTYWRPIEGTAWRDAKLEDLSVMDITKLNIIRDGGEMPVCFRPYKGWLSAEKLILQIMQGSVGSPSWVDAKMQDLLFKDGKILGGIGLVAR